MELKKKHPLFAAVIIYYAILTGTLILLVLAIFSPFELNLIQGTIYNYLVPFGVLLTYRLGVYLAKRLIDNLDTSHNPKKILDKYQFAVIIRLAAIGAGALASIISFILSRDYLYLGVLIFSFGLLLHNKPSLGGACEELDLNEEGIHALEGGTLNK